MADGIAEGGLLAPEDALGQPVALKRLAQQILALAVGVQLFGRVDAHDVTHKIQITERHAGLEAVHADGAVCAQHVVHIQLADALLALGLECGGGRRVVGVLVAEQLIGDLAGQQHADVGVLVDVLADQIHAHRRADGGNIPGAEHGDDPLQRVQHDVAVDDDLGVVGVQVVGHLLGVFQVNGVLTHADSERADRLAQLLGRNRADQARIKTARQQEAYRRVGVKALVYTGNQLFADVRQNLGQLVLAVGGRIGNVAVAHKLTVAVVAANRERIDFFAQAHEVFRLGRKGNVP